MYGTDITLTQSAPVRVGVLDVTMPLATGTYTLDVLNAEMPNWQQFGTFFSYYAVPFQWSAYQGLITGGQLEFTVVPEPATLTLLFVGACVLMG